MFVTVLDITVAPPQVVVAHQPARYVHVNPAGFIVKTDTEDRSYGHGEFSCTVSHD